MPAKGIEGAPAAAGGAIIMDGMSSTLYQAATQKAAIVEQTWTGILKLTGPDRTTWLQAMVTNDVQKLRPGEGCYAGHLNAQGKLLAQMVILCEEDAFSLLMEQENVAKIAATFDRLIIMEDVQVHNVSGEYGVIGLVGRQASSILATLIGTGARTGALYAHELHGDLRVVRDDLGYLILAKPERTPKLMADAAAAGAVAIDFETWNVLRTEAGFPLYGVDIDESTTLPELGDRGINYEKGCYIGQEVVAKIRYIGHVNRRYVGFVCEGNRIPEARSAVRAGGKDVGHVTTTLMSPGLGRPIAMGFVGRTSATPGAAVELVGPTEKDAVIPARVVALPFLEPAESIKPIEPMPN